MILFTADWHLKLGQKNVPKKWALNRYELFFEAIREKEKTCKMHIIGGDLFDRLPTMEELELYFSFVSKAQRPTLIYDGNHEATRKNKTFFTQLKDVTRSINPMVSIIDTSYVDEELGFSILPYADLHKDNSIEKFNTDWPLFTHVRGEIPPHVKPEVDLNRFDKFPVVFAGDLHAHNNTQRNIVYPGSPMTTSFHRTVVKTGFLLIAENTWDWMWDEFHLPQLIRKTIKNAEDMIPTDYNHTIYEIEGDIQQLASIKNSELLDKKVIKRNSETALIMKKDMTIEEELIEYLNYILEIDPKNVSEIIGTFNDYSQKAQME
jgi:DNA repair exonuclease SbcCD nuclease subunit